MGEESECTPLLGSPPQPRRSAARESQVLEPIITIQWGWCMSGQIADVKKMFRTQQGWSMLCWAQHQHIIWYWPFCLPGTLDILYLFARLKMDQWLRAVHCSKCWLCMQFNFLVSDLTQYLIVRHSIWLCGDYWAQSDDMPLRMQKDHNCLWPLSIEPALYKFNPKDKCVFQVGPGRMVRLNGVHLCLALFTLAVISTVTAVLLCAHQVPQLNQRKLNP